jgi:hypothetical protein
MSPFKFESTLKMEAEYLSEIPYPSIRRYGVINRKTANMIFVSCKYNLNLCVC